MSVTATTARPGWSQLKLRQSAHLRDLTADTTFTAAHLVQPLFVVEGLGTAEPISGLGDNARLGTAAAADMARRELMDLVAPAGRVYQAGTLSANPVAVRAGLKTLEKMEAADGWRVLNERTSAFCDTLRAALAGIPRAPRIIQQGSIFWMTQPDGVGAGWFARLFHHALAADVYLPPSGYEVCFLSMAHDSATLGTAATALTAAARAEGQS